jgi:DNA uptake protein ComE-like DNA-binding protein
MFRMKSAAAVVALVLFAATLALAQGTTPSSTTPSGTEPAKPAAKSTTSTTHHHSSSSKSTMKVDINSASKEELMKLPGVTEDIAEKIVSDRPFKSKSELESKSIVTKAEYQKLSAHVVAHQEKAAAAPATEKK